MKTQVPAYLLGTYMFSSFFWCMCESICHALADLCAHHIPRLGARAQKQLVRFELVHKYFGIFAREVHLSWLSLLLELDAVECKAWMTRTCRSAFRHVIGFCCRKTASKHAKPKMIPNTHNVFVVMLLKSCTSRDPLPINRCWISAINCIIHSW